MGVIVLQAAERGFIRIRNINSNDEAVEGIAQLCISIVNYT